MARGRRDQSRCERRQTPACESPCPQGGEDPTAGPGLWALAAEAGAEEPRGL